MSLYASQAKFNCWLRVNYHFAISSESKTYYMLLLVLMQVPVSSLRRWNIQCRVASPASSLSNHMEPFSLALLTDVQPEAQKSKPRARTMPGDWYIFAVFFQLILNSSYLPCLRKASSRIGLSSVEGLHCTPAESLYSLLSFGTIGGGIFDLSPSFIVICCLRRA